MAQMKSLEATNIRDQFFTNFTRYTTERDYSMRYPNPLTREYHLSMSICLTVPRRGTLPLAAIMFLPSNPHRPLRSNQVIRDS